MHVAAVSLGVVGIVFSILAATQSRGSRELLRLFKLGPWTRRSAFTDLGWRFRNVALLCWLGAAILLLV